MSQFVSQRRQFLCRVIIAGMLMMMVMGSGGVAALHASAYAATSTCRLKSARGNIQHVIYLQFDNTHFTRDNPNVPSDLEQMPNLLNFIKNNGLLLASQHTPLIAHTANDILTSLTGVYGDDHGVPIANSYQYYNPDGTSSTGISFAYWTDPIFDPSNPHPTDKNYNMINPAGLNTPAPWVPYTRVGCNVGAVGTANIELENTNVDVAKVYGPNSPQAKEAQKDPVRASADFVGIAVHCSKGDSLCAASHTGQSDLLPNEPGGYKGYMALFGHKYVAPQISPNGPLKDLNGHVIKDSQGNIGFPGFDGMQPWVSLAYVAAMQEHGVPVTYAYLSAAHESTKTGNAYGPGQAAYVAKLKAYNDAFGKFFARLASDGINSSNTLFVITADEGDHFVGGPPSPKNCDGIHVACTYNQIGEIDANLAQLLAVQQGITTPFSVHADSAPEFYLNGQPSREASVTRTFERAASRLTVVNPITGKTDVLTRYLADPVEMKILHMVNADPKRTPTFTMFADPNYYLYADSNNCAAPCVYEYAPEAWNHGDVYPQINTTWLGMVGPGVRHLGITDDVWSDHTDTRPTMLVLLGLKDDYAHDGRALFEVLENWAVPKSLLEHRADLTKLAQVYKQIDACVGELALDTLEISTKAIESNSHGDGTYKRLEAQLSSINAQRDKFAQQISTMLEQAAFDGKPINEQQAERLTEQSEDLLDQVHAMTLNP